MGNIKIIEIMADTSSLFPAEALTQANFATFM